MPDAIRLGIIGTGMMGCEHIRCFARQPDARVTAVADPDERSRGQARRALGEIVAESYADHRDLLRDACVDAVVIATPNHTHRAILDDVFRTDLAVLVEKPLCTTVEDARRVAEAAEKHAGLFWVGMEYRFMAPVARLIEQVHAGAVGRLRMFAIREHRFPFLPKVGDWNRFSRNTGGTLVEKCCHFFDLMNLVAASRPLRVYASGAQDVNHLDERYGGETPDILDNAYVIVDFESGARALLDLCMFAENSRNELELTATGDTGKLEAMIPEHTLVLTRRDRTERTRLEFEHDRGGSGGHHGSTFLEQGAFLAALRAGAPALVGARDGLLAVAMGAAAERSVRERRPVELADYDL